jgi:hypothetical protein
MLFDDTEGRISFKDVACYAGGRDGDSGSTPLHIILQ